MASLNTAVMAHSLIVSRQNTSATVGPEYKGFRVHDELKLVCY